MAGLPETVRTREVSRSRRVRRRIPFWLMAPSVVLLVLIVFIPMVFALWVSLTGLNQYTIGDWLHAPFVGLHQYLETLSPHGALFNSLMGSIKASVVFSVVTTVVILPLGLGAALVYNERFGGRALFRTIALLPYVIPTFVNALVWRLLFQTSTGPIDIILSHLHLAPQATFWLIGPNALWAMIIADVWASWPFIYMLSLAGLQSIPADLYDAAIVDGARRMNRFRHITLPLLRSPLGLAVVLSTINHFNNFTLPFVMFGATPPQQVNVLPLSIYVNSFVTFNFGLGAAMSVVALIIMLVPAVIYLRAARVGEAD
ncbi:MAG: carbohydrate ABC transporter permease [Candidatus Dormibacteraceae bacterium]